MTTALPHSKAFGEDERSVLLGYLAYHRAVLVRKVEGLSDEQARRVACPPSNLSLLGLVRHMADVERGWFREALMAENVPPLFEDGEDFRVPPDATVEVALATFWDEVSIADRNIAASSLDDLTRGGHEPGHSLRRTIVHMIEEYARHCGHADLLREAIDGATGD